MRDNFTTPEPGSTDAQLPPDILVLLPRRDYLSTACETAGDMSEAIVDHPDMTEELLDWRGLLHKYCRRNHKFRGTLCICPCHTRETE